MQPNMIDLPKQLQYLADQSSSIKEMFFKISQNLKESTCPRVSFLIKFQAGSLQFYYKRDSSTDFVL